MRATVLPLQTDKSIQKSKEIYQLPPALCELLWQGPVWVCISTSHGSLVQREGVHSLSWLIYISCTFYHLADEHMCSAELAPVMYVNIKRSLNN